MTDNYYTSTLTYSDTFLAMNKIRFFNKNNINSRVQERNHKSVAPNTPCQLLSTRWNLNAANK